MNPLITPAPEIYVGAKDRRGLLNKRAGCPPEAGDCCETALGWWCGVGSECYTADGYVGCCPAESSGSCRPKTNCYQYPPVSSCNPDTSGCTACYDSLYPYCVVETLVAVNQYVVYCAQNDIGTTTVFDPTRTAPETTSAMSTSNSKSRATSSAASITSPSTGSRSSGVSSTASKSSSASSTKSAAAQTETPKAGGVNKGAIAGGVIGGILGIALLAAIIFFLLRWWRRRDDDRDEEPDYPQMGEHQHISSGPVSPVDGGRGGFRDPTEFRSSRDAGGAVLAGGALGAGRRSHEREHKHPMFNNNSPVVSPGGATRNTPFSPGAVGNGGGPLDGNNHHYGAAATAGIGAAGIAAAHHRRNNSSNSNIDDRYGSPRRNNGPDSPGNWGSPYQDSPPPRRPFAAGGPPPPRPNWGQSNRNGVGYQSYHSAQDGDDRFSWVSGSDRMGPPAPPPGGGNGNGFGRGINNGADDRRSWSLRGDQPPQLHNEILEEVPDQERGNSPVNNARDPRRWSATSGGSGNGVRRKPLPGT